VSLICRGFEKGTSARRRRGRRRVIICHLTFVIGETAEVPDPLERWRPQGERRKRNAIYTLSFKICHLSLGRIAEERVSP
jgi:hypothetical protein